MSVTTRVDGRTLHSVSGEIAYQPYGPTSSFCNFSVSRWELNKVGPSDGGMWGESASEVPYSNTDV
jgi:hypothetical protein